MLSAAQFMLPIEIGPLFAAAGIGMNNIGSIGEGLNCSQDERIVKLMTEIRCFQEIVSKFKEMNVDPTEYVCLKAIVLFKTGEFVSMSRSDLLFAENKH